MEGKSKQEFLTCVIQSLCKGYIGMKKDNLNVDQGAVDLDNENNSLSIIMKVHGRCKAFQTNNLSSNDVIQVKPRYLFFHGKQFLFDIKKNN